VRGRQSIYFGILLLTSTIRALLAQTAPVSPDRPWHSSVERQTMAEAKRLTESRLGIDPNRPYSLADLIDLAESHNPETRIAWERARAKLAALGIARSELYPILTAAAQSQTNRYDVLFGPYYDRQTVQSFEAVLDLHYLVLDFGARSGRIAAATAQSLSANFAFNGTHRRIIYQVERTYYTAAHN